MNKRSVPLATALLPMLFVITMPSFSLADVRLSGIFSDHMVLQPERPVTIWGSAEKDEQVTVKFAGVG